MLCLRAFDIFYKLFVLTAILGLARCDDTCSNCLYGTDYCDPASHVCTFGCTPGWQSHTCTQRCIVEECKECVVVSTSIDQCVGCHAGLYGRLCNLECSDKCNGRKDSDTCDHFGNCLFGCKQPYTGPKCQQQDCPFSNCIRCDVNLYGDTYCWQCHAGYYWLSDRKQCSKCSDKCKNGPEDCDSFTGTCAQCKQGWFGDQCIYQCNVANCTTCAQNQKKTICRSCTAGMFPENDGTSCVSCEKQNCIDTCSSSTGDCLKGCQKGWYGDGYRCDRQCTIPHCIKCALNYERVAVCMNCITGYYVISGDRACDKCPPQCLHGCNDHSSTCIGGCRTGYYGQNCEFRCNLHCLNNTCDASTGYCDCEADWFGYRCDRQCPIHCTDCPSYVNGVCSGCEAHRYGPACETLCSSNCQTRDISNYIYCDQFTGKCERGCINGFYGDTCNISCNSNCESHVCDRDTGHCLSGCSHNYYGPKCEFPCPKNCTYVVQGYKRTCNALTGKCLDGCRNGKHGDFCNLTCSDRCRDNKCGQDTGDCSHGCKDGFAGRDCDIICGSGCPNDCSPNCYNAICDNTKSCIAGCVTGWYGTTCREICSEKCVGRVCKQIYGDCVGLCVNGYYGTRCTNLCSENCIYSACIKTSGFCSKGCRRMFYGDICSKLCPDQCKNGTCDRQTGTCESCGIGRHGDMCDKACVPGTYGENCVLGCGHCRDAVPCDVYTGECRAGVGCDIGYTGVMCKEALYSQNAALGPTVNVDLVIGCSVAAVVCLLIFAVAVRCLLKARTSSKMQKCDEPVVSYSEDNVTIERAGTSSTENRDSTNSDMMLLGDVSSRLQIELQQELHKLPTYTVYRGQINSGGLQTNCCVKLVKLQDLEDDKVALSRLIKESELHSLCGSHINVVQLITSYHNTDIYCVALDNSIETGLPQYLQTLLTDENALEPVQICMLLQFAIDICSALCHIHKLKVIHRMVQARHVYLTDSLVAKLGDFYWASNAEESEIQCDLPEDSYPWLSPQVMLHQLFTYQSDIWSFGMLFWEIFSVGKQPFDGSGRAEHKQMIKDGMRPSKPQIAHFTQYRVMKNCWRYSPEDRPTAEEVLQQLIDIQGRFSDIGTVVVHV